MLQLRRQATPFMGPTTRQGDGITRPSAQRATREATDSRQSQQDGPAGRVLAALGEPSASLLRRVFDAGDFYGRSLKST